MFETLHFGTKYGIQVCLIGEQERGGNTKGYIILLLRRPSTKGSEHLLNIIVHYCTISQTSDYYVFWLEYVFAAGPTYKQKARSKVDVAPRGRFGV